MKKTVDARLENHMLTGQVALVTGASRGIGAEVVAELSALGATVIGWDRTITSKDVDRLPQVLYHEVDVSDPVRVAEAADAVLKLYGRVDILVNNAGVGGPTVSLAHYEDNDWDRVIAINLTAVYRLCKKFVPAMIANGCGRVINIASTAAFRGLANSAAYSASKAAVVGLSMALAKEVGPHGVTVNCVAPGAIETEMLTEMGNGNSLISDVTAKTAVRRLGSAREVAATVAWIASPACSFTTGAVFDVSGGRLLH